MGRNKKNIILLTISFLFILQGCCLQNREKPQRQLIQSALKSRGSWKKRLICNRKSIITNKKEARAYLEFDIQTDGYYQLYVSIYHNWKKYWPYLYVKAVDCKGYEYTGFLFSEPRWYLNYNIGRWSMHTVNTNPFWYLHKGKLILEYHAESMISNWRQDEAPMEDIIAIDKFFFIPITDKDRNKISMNVIELESSYGEWNSLHYSPIYGIGLIETSLPKAVSYKKISIPISGYYTCYISALANSLPHRLKISLQKNLPNSKVKIVDILLNNSSDWEDYYVGQLYLDKGEYILKVKNDEMKEDRRVGIDYFLLFYDSISRDDVHCRG